MAGGARLAAGAALAAPALRLLAAPGAARAADAAAGLTEAGYWAFVDPIAERMDHLWDAGDRCYRIGRRGRVGDQRRPADDPRGGRAARSPRRRSRRRPRARAGRPDVRVASVERARARHAARQDVPRRWLARPACARPARGWRSPSTPRSPRGWRARGGRATSSGSRPPRRSAWPRSCSAARTEPSSATPTSASTRSTGTPRSSPTPRR